MATVCVFSILSVLLIVVLLTIVFWRRVPMLQFPSYMYGQIPELDAPLPTKHSNVIIVSGTSNRAKRAWVDPVVRLQTQYAQDHGADYWFVDLDKYPYPHLGVRSPHWQKLAIVSKALPHYEYVMWIDDDAAPVPKSGKSFRTLLHHAGNTDFIGFRDMKPVDKVNTGVFFLRNSPWSHRLLSIVWNSAHMYYPGHKGGEQRAVNELVLLPDCPRLALVHTIGTGAKRQIDNGDPIRGPHVCIYNEEAGNSPWSSFIVHLAGPKNKRRRGRFDTLSPLTPGLRTTYPWVPLKNRVMLTDHSSISAPVTTFNVPMCIYQTFETADVLPEMAAASASWRTLNPQFEYRFYDALDTYEFIRAHFTSKVVNAYKLIRAGGFRADLFSYCILYQYGGVYVDLGCVAQEPIPNDWPDFVTVKDRLQYGGFMYATPKHPILKAAIDLCVSRVINVAAGSMSYNCLSVSGPGVLGDAVLQVTGLKEFTVGKTESGVYLMMYHKSDPYVINPATGGTFMKTSYGTSKNSDLRKLTGKDKYGKMLKDGTAIDSPLFSTNFFLSETEFMNSDMATGIITPMPLTAQARKALLQKVVRVKMGETVSFEDGVRLIERN